MPSYSEKILAIEPTLTAEESELGLLDILLVITENLRLLVIGPVVLGLIALGIAFFIAPTYTSEAKFLPPQQQQSSAAGMLQSLGAVGSLAGAASGLKNPTDQYVALLKSTTVEDALVKQFELSTRYEQTFAEDARKTLEQNSRISGGKDGLITVAFEDKDPQFAANVANAYIDELGRLLNRLAVTEAQQRRVFFEKQLTDTKNKLTVAQKALAASGIGVNAVNTNPTTAIEGPTRLRAQVTAQEVKLASLRSYLTGSAPELRQAQAELDALRSELVKSEKEQPSSVGGNDYIAKFREFKYQETLFDLFARQFELAKVDESKEGALIQVVDAAKPAERKSKPRRGIIAITAAIATGFILLVFVFLRHSLRVVAEGDDPIAAGKLARLKSVLRGFLRRA